MANFPSYPAATNKTDSTASATDHPNHHNILGAAVNFVNDAINAEVTRATTAEGLKVATSALGVTVPTLVGGKVPAAQLPQMVIDNTYVVASQAAMLALSANVGDIAVRTDTSANYILQTAPATTLGNWVRLFGASGAVAATSVTFADRSGGSIASTDVNGAIIEVRDEAGGGSPNQGKPGIPPTGCLFGAQVRLKAGQSGTDVNAMAALETQFAMGRFGARRSYVTAGGNFDLTQVATRMADDADPTNGVRTSVVSLRPPTDPGTGSPHLWAYMATNPTLPGGSEGCLTHAAKAFGAYSHPIVAMVDHEMDRTVNNRGTASEYAAFASAFFTELRTWAPRVSTLVCFGGYPLYAGSMTQNQAAAYLPSNLALLDIIGVDPYQAAVNSSTPTAQDAVVLDFFDGASGMIAPFLTLANTNGKKPVAICEMGTSWETELSAHSREEVWGRALLYAKQNPQIKMVLAFHDNVGAPGNTAHNWYLDDTPTLLNALKSKSFTAAGNTYPGLADTYFHPVVGGAGGSVASVDLDGTGGQTGNVVVPRNSNTNIASMRTIDGTSGSALPYTVTAVGDLIVGTAFGALRMGKGSTGKVLTVDATAGSVGGLNWITPATGSANYTGHPVIVAASTTSSTVQTMATATGGGVCTGTNDQTVIQAALDLTTDPSDTTNYGRDVLLTAGTFNVTTVSHPSGNGWKTALSLADGARLRGSGVGVTKIKLSTNAAGGPTDPGSGNDTNPQGNNAYVIVNDAPTAGNVDCYLADFTIDGNSANQNRHQHGIVWWFSNRIVHERLLVKNMRGTAGSGAGETFAYDAKSSANISWSECRAEGPSIALLTSGATATGFSSNQGSYLSYVNCTAQGLGVMGFTLYQARNVVYTNCVARLNLAQGFNAEGSFDLTYTGCIAGGAASANAVSPPYSAGQDLGNAGNGFNLSTAAGAGCDGWTIQGCHSSRNDNGIFVNTSKNGRIIGGTSRNNTKGIVFTGTGAATLNEVSSVHMESNSTTDIEVSGYTKQGGGTNFNVLLDGAVEPIAPPASAATVASPYPFRVTVYVTGGTLTNLQLIDRNAVTTTLGAAATTFVLPHGFSVKPTYTGTLTWEMVAG